MVVSQGMRMAVVGLGFGLAGSLVFCRLLASMLYEVKPTDPLTLGLVSIGLAGVALIANYIPPDGRQESIPWWRCAASNRDKVSKALSQYHVHGGACRRLSHQNLVRAVKR